MPLHRIKKNSELRKKVGQLIQAYRIKQGWTQVSLAKFLGISQGNLSKIESGALLPDASQWLKFCLKTGLRPLELFSLSQVKSVRSAKIETSKYQKKAA
jgi:transcriptional regulator with XRE-family HTH domain